MADALRSVSNRVTVQTQRADARQVKNNAGGFTFKLTPQAQLRRFLILGVDGGTYYQSAPALARENAGVVENLARTNPALLVDEIIEVGTKNLAPRANPVLFALAMAASPSVNEDVEQRTRALQVLPEIARTATQLFIFLNYVQQFRGWGPGLRKAVANWYTSKSTSQAAYQVVKYRQREGWTHRDVLRQAHPKAVTATEAKLYDYACGRDVEFDGDDALRIIEGFEKAKRATSEKEFVALISEYGLSWEMLPDEALKSANVWRAMIEKGMPQTALMRQLPRLTNLDVLRGEFQTKVAKQLSDPEAIKKGRLHPFNVLNALATYSSGHGFRGGQTWTPVSKVVNALDSAFYTAFGNVKPSGKSHLLALDVSGSMGLYSIANSALKAREASVAMAMVTAAVEENCEIVGFTSGYRGGSYDYNGGAISSLDVSPRRRLDDNVNAVSRLNFGGTDCSLPMLYAMKNKLKVEQFVIYTDNETWAGRVHPHQALRQYRDASGIDAKLVVVGMTSTGFSIADPSDAGMLDVVGFDSSAPALMTEFATGNL
ncbi:Ro-like RNA binding protein [Gordonia phage Sixama]|uniref:Ro-like RNA binding protein n=1 Tax=Gordonia phage Sixama TaxID=2653271 RepID=A0A5Q2F6F7_9CAUD|nr:Ro-like RNA binding protein [Gordonia phage Sixama]QGF20313.1 Ro-like RNA binding protein [Gordonia phage Sixama]